MTSLRKLLHFLKPYTVLIVITCLLLLCQTIGNLSLPRFLSNIIDNGITAGNMNYILRIGVYMIFAAILTSAVGMGAMYTSSKVAMSVGRDLRHALFEKIESFSLGEFNNLGTSSLITRTTNDVYQVQQLVVMSLRLMIIAPLMAIGGIVMAISTNASLSLTLLVSVPVLALVIFVIGRKTVPLYNQIQTKLDKVNLILRENLTGIRVIRAFNKTKYEEERFKEASLDLTNNAIGVNKLMAILMPGIMIVLNLTTVAILWFGSRKVSNGLLEVGSLIAFIQYVMQIMFSLVMLTMIFVLIPRALASANRISEVLGILNSITDKVAPSDISTPSSLTRAHLRFEDVSFTYPGSQKPILSHISFDVGPGETLAIIGGTGSGKSTLLNLIPRFYDITSGRILIDSLDIKDYSLTDLRKKIGYVPQKNFLFSGSVASNLAFGKENATEDELTKALTTAQGIDFVSSMPEGTHSPITQGGTNVSGGQRQRLAIARALMKNAEFYLFDDSFSALDFKTDSQLRKALAADVTNSAVIIVGQRITSIMHANTILVLDDHTIVGKGTHKELLKNCKTYREIAESQLSKKELEGGHAL
ncbi:ABC transporter ATP-binding protein [Cellulosilyticum ruminicola]|uniref:ABC transporter ATP-binding protein n=1 Tax=Cellulosilyticum ruminicola TaxID=425254 RepID=UPI00278BEAED|nr:ABC transporter ATP-binding protein [Cellulosilyticum ruminicola]